MRIRYWAAAFALFLLCCVAAAQEDYYIRTDARINLRASYSLEAEKVATVEAGTVLHVVGRFNRWLKIDRDGQIVWMADWVYYTRVGDDSSQERSSSQDQLDPGSLQVVDNCCQVDRQCNTEQEWTAGYYAFLNKHCSAPTRISEGGIVIEGSPVFAIQVEKALDLLKSRSPEWYAYVNGGLARVKEVPETKRTSVNIENRVVDVTPAHAFLPGFSSESGVIWLAGILVHEACHVYRLRAGNPYRTEFERFKEEVICQQIQIDALEVVDPRKRFSNYLQGLIDDFFSRGYSLTD